MVFTAHTPSTLAGATPVARNQPKRRQLTPALVLDAAVAIADETGIADLTIRRLAQALEVKPMSIYHHIPNKEAIIDGMVDVVFAEIELPPADLGWRQAIEVRSRSMREVLRRHPWATPLMESRSNPGMATLTHHDAVLGCLRSAGMSLELTGHAYAIIDAFLYGFALHEANLPATTGDELSELATEIIDRLAAESFPHLAEFTAHRVLGTNYDFADEFDYALSLILDGVQQRADAER